MNTLQNNENINKIAQLSDKICNTSDYNKAAIFSIVKSLVENNGQLTDREQACLYKHFTPKIPAKPKTNDQWVALAMADKYEVRFYLQYIYSDGKRIMATDGHRVHILKTDKYEAGFYDKGMIKMEHIDAKFPDVDKVIPTGKKEFKVSDLVLKDHDGRKQFKQVYDFDDVRVCSKYIKQAACTFDDPVIQYSDKNSSMMIKQGDKLAVVMPMRK